MISQDLMKELKELMPEETHRVIGFGNAALIRHSLHRIMSEILRNLTPQKIVAAFANNTEESDVLCVAKKYIAMERIYLNLLRYKN